MKQDQSLPPFDSLSDAKKRLFEVLLKDKLSPKVLARQGIITGEVAITPPQAHEFDIYNPDRHIFNLFLLLEVHVLFDLIELEKIVRALLEHHDALRLCSIKGPEGWRQCIAAPPATPPVSSIDLASLTDEMEQRAVLEAHIAALQQSFDLSVGPLFKVAYFNLGPKKPPRLLLLLHHIACDHYSSTILVEDFLTAYQQIRNGQTITFPAKTTSYLDWSHRLAQHAHSEAALQELPFWLNQRWQDSCPIPVDYPHGVGHVSGHIDYTLDLNAYPHLSHYYLKSYNVQLHHVLVFAIARALTDWSGGSKALISMCHHGRNHPFKDIDISRTVGWFSYQYPLLIDLSGNYSELKKLQNVKEQIDLVPNNGLNYGILRYMAKAHIIERIKTLPEPDMFLNIRIGTQITMPGFTQATENCGDGMSSTAIPPRHIYLNVDINDNFVLFHCMYNKSVIDVLSVDRFIQNFVKYVQIIEDALRRSAVGQQKGII